MCSVLGCLEHHPPLTLGVRSGMDTVTEYILYQQILENKVQLKVLLLATKKLSYYSLE